MGILTSTKMEPEIVEETGTEFELKFQPDPEPGERPATRGRPRGPAKPTSDLTSTQVKRLSKEVGEQLAGLIDMGGTLWEMAGDECCAPIIQDESKPIGEAIAACLARNPKLLARFADVDFVTWTLQLGALGKALKPVAAAIWRNHISGAHDGEEKNGAGIDLGAFPSYAA